MSLTTGSIETSSFTHTGLVRKRNEDAILSLPKAGLWAVADGMGGHQQGDFASRCVISHLYQLATKTRGRELAVRLPAVIQDANREILEQAMKGGAQHVIGTTLVALVLEGDRYHCFWSGDSRIYLYRQGELTLLTSDHTRAQMMRDRGTYTDAEINAHPASQALTQAIGIEPKAFIDYNQHLIYEGDRFLLCSDGLTKVFSHDQLARGVAATDLDQVNMSFLSSALDAGAPDNISSILVGL